MRLGYVTGCYPRVSDTFIQREVAALRSLGMAVDTFAVRAPGAGHLLGPEQQAEHARTTYLLPAGAGDLVRAHAGWLLRAPRRWLRAARIAREIRQPGVRGTLLSLAYFAEAGLLARDVRRRRIDHLHNHFGDSSGSTTMLAAALAGVGFSMTVHGPDVFFDRERARLDVKVREADFVACISSFARSQVMAVSTPERWGDLHVVHCGVDPSSFLRHDPPGESFTVVSVGRLEPVKGVRLLLEAVSRLTGRIDGICLVVVGDGDERAGLETLALELGIGDRVRFAGSLTQGAVRDVLRTADVFATASFAEGLPVVLMEALASGTPVVSPSIMGVPELVDGSVGRLVPPADVGALTDALGELHDLGPQERRLLGEAGRQVVARRFDVRQEARVLAGLFQRYAGSPPPGAGRPRRAR